MTTLLHTETFTRRHDCGTVSRNVIKIEKLNADQAAITILTDEREIGERFFTPVLHRFVSQGGREGMIWNLRTARKHCQQRGYERAA